MKRLTTIIGAISPTAFCAENAEKRSRLRRGRYPAVAITEPHSGAKSSAPLLTRKARTSLPAQNLSAK
jgi:hypothetical protein